MNFQKLIVTGIAVLSFAASSHAQGQDREVNVLIEQIEAHFPNQRDEAERYLEQALELAPEHPQVNYYCGMIYGLKAGDGMFSTMRYAGKSRDCLELAVEKEPDNLSYRLALFNYYLNAPGIVGGGRDKASEEVEHIKLLDEESGVIAQLRLTNVFNSDQYANALQNAALEFPDFAAVQLRFGLQQQNEGNYQIAHETFVQAAEIKSAKNTVDATYLNALYQIGRTAIFSDAHIEQGIAAMQSYLEHFDETLEIPELAWAYARMAQLQAAANREEQTSHFKSLSSQFARDNDDDLFALLNNL